MAQIKTEYDVLIVGAGIVGLSVGIALLEAKPNLRVVAVEKELDLGRHASGRNSGVLHAGFYYSPESMKAKFCRVGNLELRRIAKKYEIPVNEVGKVVVACNQDENSRLNLLFERGLANGVDLEILDESVLPKFEPLARTSARFIWSPTTAVSDPKSILRAISKEFISMGGLIHFGANLDLEERQGEIVEKSNQYSAKFIVNAAGAHADRISRAVGVGLEYAMLPFMGTYRVTNKINLPLKRLVYPVPHPHNPFLGVHFTLTSDGFVKIGPTAIPLLGREQYSLFTGWSASDFSQALKGAKALAQNQGNNLSSMIKSEWPKVIPHNLVKDAIRLVPNAAEVSHWHRKPPGIRSQLVHLPTGRLEQDFVVDTHINSVHILNAVSPGWTSAIPFGKWVVDQFLARV
jgi:L-2-hydroxyglutarate oxidase LhgO